ncbi:XRE family transcriptional regulator [Trinickia dinghuensis]|uniref:XRE family transcriptional regulator n=2 Tax=Trinickia dinghuensis TaxID=2291023 RepID=A0A3D8K6N5_9BURK|nr:XRE family transcriptional regulator [Trinickia dinghuensis]
MRPEAHFTFQAHRNKKAAPVILSGRIRTLRQRLKRTLDCTARAAGISKPFLSQIERGLATPSLASLKGIADALGVAVQYFIDAPSERNAVCRGDEVKFFEFADSANSFARLTRGSGCGQLEAILVKFPPHQSEPTEIPTSAEEAFLYVTAGEISLTLEGKTVVLKAGDSAHYQSASPHAWLNTQSTEALAIWVGTPNLL